jgi:uncharacterized protein
MKVKTRKLVLAGGSGFLGQLLSEWFAQRNWEVVILTRQQRQKAGEIRNVVWNGFLNGEWTHELEGAEVLINLAGRSVNCRYTARNRAEILSSRIEPTRLLGEVIARCQRPPVVWMNASTATIYRHSYGEPHDEHGEIMGTPEAKDQFSVEVAVAWEKAFDQMATPHTRKVALRLAMVLGLGANSVFPALRNLARFGLGGKLGHGRQFVSWIHAEDFCRAVEWLIDHQDVDGAVNVAAPNPLTNRAMMSIVRSVCGLPVGLPAPEWLLEIGTFLLRTETELVIKSRRVMPTRLARGGFEFRFQNFADAAADLERRIRER